MLVDLLILGFVSIASFGIGFLQGLDSDIHRQREMRGYSPGIPLTREQC